jgi:hypothetical protein
MILLPHEQAIIIPASFDPDMSDQEFNLELDLMIERSQLASEIINSGVGLKDYLELIQSQNIDVDSYIGALEQCLIIF